MIKQAQEAKQDSEEGEKASDAGNPTRIEFRQASAESVPFVQDGQVDIVTAAQSSHWFDFPKLWPELSRVVRPGGTLAFWGYKDHVFVNFPKASEILQSYAYDSDPDRLGSYWPQPGRSYLQDQLRIIQPPREDWTDLERVEYEPATNGRASGQGTLLMERTIAIASCKAYIRTWSSYHGWKQAHPAQVARSEGGSGDVVDKMFDEMAQTHKHFDNEENEVEIEWGTALVMARRK
jgi:SAM-dependent methyltransferase